MLDFIVDVSGIDTRRLYDSCAFVLLNTSDLIAEPTELKDAMAMMLVTMSRPKIMVIMNPTHIQIKVKSYNPKMVLEVILTAITVTGKPSKTFYCHRRVSGQPSKTFYCYRRVSGQPSKTFSPWCFIKVAGKPPKTSIMVTGEPSKTSVVGKPCKTLTISGIDEVAGYPSKTLEVAGKPTKTQEVSGQPLKTQVSLGMVWGNPETPRFQGNPIKTSYNGLVWGKPETPRFQGNPTKTFYNGLVWGKPETSRFRGPLTKTPYNQALPMVGGQPKTLGIMPNKVVLGQPSKTQYSIHAHFAVKTCPRREADRCPKFRRSEDDSHDFKFANNSTMVACCQTWYHACLSGDAKESDPRSVTVESGYRESFSIIVIVGFPLLGSCVTAGRHLSPIIFYISFSGFPLTMFCFVFFPFFVSVIGHIKYACLPGRVVRAGLSAASISVCLCPGCALPSRGAIVGLGSVVSLAFLSQVFQSGWFFFIRRFYRARSIHSPAHSTIHTLSPDVSISPAPSSSSSTPIVIFIKFSTQIFQVSVSSNDTIFSLKHIFHSKCKFSPALRQLRLSYQNVLLLDTLPVSFYNILPGSTIRSSFQLLGGSDSSSDAELGETTLPMTFDDNADKKAATSNISFKTTPMVPSKPTKFFLDEMQSPETWLMTIETTYGVRNLHKSRDKFNFLLPLVPSNYSAKLTSVIKQTIASDCKHPYSVFRGALMQLLQPTKSNLFSKYFRDQTLGDLLPSKFLAKCTVDLESMQKGASGDEAMLRRFFLSALPVQHQQILSVLSSATISELALSADKLAEIAQPHLTAHVEVPSLPIPGASAQNFDTAGLIAAITSLSHRLSGLEAGFDRFNHDDRRSARSPNRGTTFSRGNSSSRNRSPTPNNQRQPLLCTYHYRFGDEAQYCHLGCQAQNVNTACKRLDVCVYHARFKRNARNCVTGCKFNTRADAMEPNTVKNI